jgi:hypothetical protein
VGRELFVIIEVQTHCYAVISRLGTTELEVLLESLQAKENRTKKEECNCRSNEGN